MAVTASVILLNKFSLSTKTAAVAEQDLYETGDTRKEWKIIIMRSMLQFALENNINNYLPKADIDRLTAILFELC